LGRLLADLLTEPGTVIDMLSQPSDPNCSETGWSIDELLNPAAFAHPVHDLTLRETPLSWVILTGDFAYKIKKPVRREFVDASTLPKRRTLCLEELRLNRRLSSDLYCDVVEVCRAGSHLHLGAGGDVLDYAVKMRQFDASCELSSLLDRRNVQCPSVERLAESLAEFHRYAPRAEAIDYYQKIRQVMLGNLATLLAHLSDVAAAPALEHLIDWIHDALERHRGALEARYRSGFVRECHGDLHARNIVLWQGALTPFDCLEFDRALRYVDTMDDLAFLIMDLWSYRRQDLACVVLNRYCECTGDYDGLRLLPLYAVHRALVRAMVDAFAAESGPKSTEALAKLKKRVAVADQFARPQTPALILMHGPSGSGKSYLSGMMLKQLPAIRIRSDRERKRLASGASSDPALYSTENRHRTYTRLLDCAEAVLEGGFTALIDATFLEQEERERFADLAHSVNAPFVIVDCAASRETLVARIKNRQRQAWDPSEADPQVLERQLLEMQELAPEEEACSIRVWTDRADLETDIAALQRRLGTGGANASAAVALSSGAATVGDHCRDVRR
jgi:aminoglycoside phosphotransferase family enzyme/predicted kinase